jgi:hypothetical protein
MRQIAAGAMIGFTLFEQRTLGQRGTTRWPAASATLFDRSASRAAAPSIDYVADRRMVLDGDVVTTTGITAPMPMMLMLIEAIAGRVKAQSVAHDLGLEERDARHASGAFRLTRPFATMVLLNRLAFWNHEELGIRLAPGMDKMPLALVADAWSLT